MRRKQLLLQNRRCERPGRRVALERVAAQGNDLRRTAIEQSGVRVAQDAAVAEADRPVLGVHTKGVRLDDRVLDVDDRRDGRDIEAFAAAADVAVCLLYTSPSPRDS